MNLSRFGRIKEILFAVTLVFVCQFQLLFAQPYGIDSPDAMGIFLNNSLPSQTPTGEIVTEWEVVDAFPNVKFNDPLDLREIPGNKFLVISKNGKMWTFDNDPNASTKTLFLDISDRIKTNVEGDNGVFGAILHPEYGIANSPNQYLYVVYRHFYADIFNRGYARLSRFTVSNGLADPNSEFIMINQFDGHDWHNGGSMFFGPEDGFLYISIGDEGSNNDQFNSAQTLEKGLFSGILRIDVDRRGGNISHPIRRQPTFARNPPAGWPGSYSQGYFIPNDNPWLAPDSSHLEEFYAIGFRSCHRMCYDEPTGDIWIGDVGQATREEVTIIRKGDNAQWPYKEGLIDGARPKPSQIIGNEKPPLFDMTRDEAHAVMGGIVYRGGKWSNSLEGKYIFATHKYQTVYTVDYYNTGSAEKTLMLTLPFLTSTPRDGPVHIYKDQVGEVYILHLMGDKTDGIIYKLNPKSSIPSPINAPTLLSQTGAFSDLSSLTPAKGLVPFEPNVTFWSDGASKKRWIALPNDGSHNSAAEQIVFSENGDWTFPNGTVFVKHFDLLMDETDPSSSKKIETRFTVKGEDGQIYFLTYRWREDESDADLVVGGADRTLSIQTASGTQQQTWHYPNNSECFTCHSTSESLGINTRQLNGNFSYPSGVADNQLRTMNHLNWFSNPLNEGNIPGYLSVSPISDASASLEKRALSYLDVNCGYCHEPGNVQVNIDFRFTTPLDQKNIMQVDPEDDLGIQGAKRIFQGDHSRSVIFHRMNSLQTAVMMPPLSKFLVDQEGTDLIRDWINSLDPFVDQEPPTVPTGLSAINIQGTQLTLTWEASDDNVSVGGYQIFQDGSSVPIATVDALSYTVTGLQPNTPYFYALAAMDTSGNVSNQSSSIQVQTLEVDPCLGQADVTIDPAGPFTTDQGIQQLAGNPAGGTWSGAANVDGTFDPGQGANVYSVSYTVDFGGGCIQSAEAVITVTDPPTGECTVPYNLALNQPATQSSIFEQGVASFTNDGNTVGNDFKGTDANLSHTLYGDARPWWKVDLGTASTLDRVVIFNRTDATEKQLQRLRNFYLYFSLEDMDGAQGHATLKADPAIDWVYFSSEMGTEELLQLNEIQARYVMIKLNGNGPLHMAELEVYGCPGEGGGVDPCLGQPEVTIDPAGPFTSDQGLQQLTADPIGGTWSGSANANGTFDPGQGIGTYTVTYTVDLGNGCIKSTDATIEVTTPSDPCLGQLDVTINPAGPFTTDQEVQQLSGNPSGGSWSGSANADGTFDPSQGAGLYTVTYTVDFGDGCSKSVDASITVNAPGDPCTGQPDVTVDPAGPFTTDQGIQQLSGNPDGGIWSGSVNADGTFDPSQGAGSYTVTYTVDFGDGCIQSDQISIVVNEPPTGDCTIPYNLALNQPSSHSSTNEEGIASFTNDGNTIGDDFSGTDANLSHTAFGDNQPWWKVDLGTSSTLDRVVLYNRNTSNSRHLSRLKSFYLYFSDSEMDGERSHSSLKNDGAIEWIHYTGEVGTDETIQLNALEARHVMIKLIGNGPLHIAEFEIYGCPGEGGGGDPCAGQPDVTIAPAGPFTTDQGIQQLIANPSGGTWSGGANTDGSFDPSQGEGSYIVTYSVDFGNGCIKSNDITIIVNAQGDPCTGQPVVAINPAGPFTTDQGIQQLSGNPAGGAWSGAANASGAFDPSQGAGTYTVIYTVDFGDGCVQSDDLSITVTDPPTGECSVPYNMAFNQPSTQSSTNAEGVASFTNDGNTIGDDFTGADANLSHTEFGDNQPWWKVDLGTIATLDRAVLYNRNTSNVKHLGRLKNFYLYLSNVNLDGELSHSSLKNDAAIEWIRFLDEVGPDETIQLDNIQARYVMVKLAGNGPLHIAELEIYGCPSSVSNARMAEEAYTPSKQEEIVKQPQIHLIPNPTDRHTGLKVVLSIPESEFVKVELYSMEGRLVQHQIQKGLIRETKFSLSLSNLPSGVYLIRSYGEGWELSRRLILE